jgi:hypothetical protein
LTLALTSFVRLIQSSAPTLDDPTGDASGGSIEAQREYVAELVALLVDARPDLDVAEARTCIQIGLILVADLYRESALSSQATFQGDATALVLRVVGVTGHPS